MRMGSILQLEELEATEREFNKVYMVQKSHNQSDSINIEKRDIYKIADANPVTSNKVKIEQLLECSVSGPRGSKGVQDRHPQER